MNLSTSIKVDFQDKLFVLYLEVFNPADLAVIHFNEEKIKKYILELLYLYFEVIPDKYKDICDTVSEKSIEFIQSNLDNKFTIVNANSMIINFNCAVLAKYKKE